MGRGKSADEMQEDGKYGLDIFTELNHTKKNTDYRSRA